MPMLKMLSGLVAVAHTRVVCRDGRSQDVGGRAEFHPPGVQHEGLGPLDASTKESWWALPDNLPAPRVHEAMAIAERMSVKTCRTPGCSSAHVMKGPPGGRPFAVGDRVRSVCHSRDTGEGTVVECWDTGHVVVKWDGWHNEELYGETGLVGAPDGGLCFRCHDRAWFAPRSKVDPGPCDGHRSARGNEEDSIRRDGDEEDSARHEHRRVELCRAFN